MLDVVMRNEVTDTSYILMPGQAFPIQPRDNKNRIVGKTQIWLYSVLMSNGKFYTDRSSAPMSVADLQTNGVYNSAVTSSDFGLSVYTINPEHDTGVFTESNDVPNQRTLWRSALPIRKYVELQYTSMAKPFDSALVFTPCLYAKLKDGVKPNPLLDVLLWDATCQQWQYFRKTDIPLVLDDYIKARRRNAPWSKSTMCHSPNAVKGYYFEAWEDDIQQEHLFIAYNEQPIKGVCERLYTRQEFNEERTFYGSTYRRYIEVPYVAGDATVFIDSGRNQARNLTLDKIVDKAKEYNYLSEL